jgi:CheY-like chemotaxis protein
MYPERNSSNQFPKILVVDDEDINLAIINRHLEAHNFKIFNATSGEQALSLLKSNNEGFDLVLMDKFMEGISGIEVLKEIKSDPDLNHLPVILQTVDASPENILEGIRAGAFYYLIKPFSASQLSLVVTNALKNYSQIRLVHDELTNIKLALELVDEISFSFRTREQAQQITNILTRICGLNMVQKMGLIELMLNAVEHGNLAISYDEKTRLITDNQLELEITKRLMMPRYANKIATSKFRRCGNSFIFTVSDQGKGFDWRPFLEMMPDRIHDNHGRGIAIANKMSFNNLKYLGLGNIVEATIELGTH